jgi:hypothetical protein
MEVNMAFVTREVDNESLNWAKRISGDQSDSGALAAALQFYLTQGRKMKMLEGIRNHKDMPTGLNAPKVDYPLT